MDDPVTDVLILSDPINCPEGYTVLRECPCGHEAQLWEKVHGGKDNTRYLCFTKKRLSNDADEDKVIESLYIPGSGVQYLMPYYEVIPKTFEGDREPLRHKQLALKKVKRSEAKEVVADIVVAKGKDSISKKFKKLEKINGVRICFRQEKYTPSPAPVRPTRTMDDMVLGTKNLSLESPRTRAQTVAPKHNLRHTSPPAESGYRRSSMPESEPAYPPPPHSATAGTNPPIVEEVVAVKLVQDLGSIPPPSVNSSTANQPDVNRPTDQRDELDSPVTNYPPPRDPQPSGPVTNYPPPRDPQPSGPVTNYPPPRDPQPSGPVGPAHQQPYYQPSAPSGGYPGSQYPPSTGYPQPASYHHPHGYPQQGVYQAQPYGQPSMFPHAAAPPPTTTVGYDTTIGFSLGGGVNTYPTPQQGYHPPQYVTPPGQYPPSFPRASAPNQPPSGPSNNPQSNIGFNF